MSHKIGIIESDEISSISCICSSCKHWIPGLRECAAFPDGIPLVIWTGENDHRKAYRGDHGIRFEARKRAEDAEAA